MLVADNPKKVKPGQETMSQPLSFCVPLAFPAVCIWQHVHLDLPHLPVSFEWLEGFVDTFVNNPAVGGEFNLLTSLELGLGFQLKLKFLCELSLLR